ncbi:MAG: phosphoribosylglycinamide formyltransferase [Candidatus Omnitrophica bacterium 4484_70.2]|nr:MAG: phosphoribosylglycinamide formyltransferase [Candidatus Omnitrophica bacterium 4484_70.2]
MNIAILASGKGTNFEAIVRAVKKGDIRNVQVKLLVTDREEAFVRKRARRLKIKEVFIDPSNFSFREDFEKALVRVLVREKVELVVLAGFMRILSSYFIKKFKNKILNIHPSLLPAFKGVNAIERAYKYGVKITGVTVHFVDEKVDHGPIILQGAVKVKPGESLEEVEKKIHKLEHNLYPQAIKLLVEKRLKIKGRCVEII